MSSSSTCRGPRTGVRTTASAPIRSGQPRATREMPDLEWDSNSEPASGDRSESLSRHPARRRTVGGAWKNRDARDLLAEARVPLLKGISTTRTVATVTTIRVRFSASVARIRIRPGSTAARATWVRAPRSTHSPETSSIRPPTPSPGVSRISPVGFRSPFRSS